MRIVVSQDRYLGQATRRGLKDETQRSYRRYLYKFADRFHPEATVSEVTLDSLETFLDGYAGKSASTVRVVTIALQQWIGWCYDHDLVDDQLLVRVERIPKPRRLPPEEIHVPSVSADQVRQAIDAVRDPQEWLCLACPLYFGARRGALSKLRRRDVDLDAGTVLLQEKGGKVRTVKLPWEFVAGLRELDQRSYWPTPDSYLIPNRRPNGVRNAERDDRIIWMTIRKVFARVGVRGTTHALRAAFAVAFDDNHPDQLVALQEMLGHASLDTTRRHYLRRKDKQQAQEFVRDLSWAAPAVLPAKAVEAHTGFEPVLSPTAAADGIRLKLDELLAGNQLRASCGTA